MFMIRPERRGDETAIRAVHEQAFGVPDVGTLVEMLRRRGKVTISMVAIKDDRIVGHIVFSPVTIERGGKPAHGLGLAPVAVLPEFQRRGIAGQLIREGLDECRKTPHGFVVVLGDVCRFSQFGFDRASSYQLRNPYGAEDEFMVLELKPDALAGVGGMVSYQPEFAETGV